jgi:hypothetical protein
VLADDEEDEPLVAVVALAVAPLVEVALPLEPLLDAAALLLEDAEVAPAEEVALVPAPLVELAPLLDVALEVAVLLEAEPDEVELVARPPVEEVAALLELACVPLEEVEAELELWPPGAWKHPVASTAARSPARRRIRRPYLWIGRGPRDLE